MRFHFKDKTPVILEKPQCAFSLWDLDTKSKGGGDDPGNLKIPGTTKNDEPRTVYLDNELVAIFSQKWQNRKNSGILLPRVFLNKAGDGKVKRFDKAWKTACNDAKIGIRLFHDFRRTAVRNMVRSGINERVAMMISGHKTRSVFDRYNIVNGTDLKLAAFKQQAYLKKPTGTISGTIHQFQPESGRKKTA